MNQLERESIRYQATGYMEMSGGNLKDEKSKAAYERFKRPVYHLKDYYARKRLENMKTLEQVQAEMNIATVMTTEDFADQVKHGYLTAT